MLPHKGFSIAAILLAPLITSLSIFTPIPSGPTYSIGIPSASTISTSQTGPLYFSISAPTTYQWVGLGIGTRMAQATIFVMYADGKGNVTVSGRAGGGGHVMPRLDEDLMKGVTLLEGTGILGGKMVANVKCTTCELSSEKTSTAAPWIAAWNEGSPLNTANLGAIINQHGDDSYRQFTFDLSKAAIASDANPFVSSASDPSSTEGGSGSTPTSVNPGATSTPASDPSSSSGSVSGSSSSVINDGSASKSENYHKAHGIIMGLVVTILFPSGAIFVRLHGHAWIHAGIQILSLICMIVGLGLGVELAKLEDLVFNNTHTIFGVAIVALFLIQPFLGLVHHFLFKKNHTRNVFSHLHIWYGRALMILAAVNGGLGLKLADNSRGGTIAYSVIAGVFGAGYIASVLIKRKGKPMTMGMGKSEKGVEQTSLQNSSGQI